MLYRKLLRDIYNVELAQLELEKLIDPNHFNLNRQEVSHLLQVAR